MDIVEKPQEPPTLKATPLGGYCLIVLIVLLNYVLVGEEIYQHPSYSSCGGSVLDRVRLVCGVSLLLNDDEFCEVV